MRLIWGSFLLTGLFMIGLSVYERRELRHERPGYEDVGGPIHGSEDGVPNPSPTPSPKLR